MNYFFRTISDGYIFPMLSKFHIIALIIIICGIILIKLKENLRDLIKPVLIILLLIEQLLLYSWYFFIKGFNPIEALPLYSCRFAIIIVLIGSFLKSDLLKLFGSYLGFPGGLIAIIFPVPDYYSFPHITNFAYFIGHISLTWLCLIYLLEIKSSKDKMKNILLFTHIYLIITYMADKKLGSNYAYLLWSPIFTSFFDKFNHTKYLIIVYIIYAIIFFSTYMIFKNNSDNLNKEE